MYYPVERVRILAGELMAPATIRTFTNILPLDGCGWYKIRLHFHAALAAIVAPYTDAMYRWIKAVTVRTSRGETLVNAVPGMALYRLNCYLNHSTPAHTHLLAAGNAAVEAQLEIPFTFNFLSRKEDTILDTGRYSNVELQITTGTIADLSAAGAVDWTAPGVTMCIELVRTMAAIKGLDGKPMALPYISTYPLVHVDVTPYWDLESSLDLGLFGFFIYNRGAMPIPFCCLTGGGSDVLTDVTLRDSARTWLSLVNFSTFQQERKELLPYNDAGILVATEIPTSEVGMYPHWFVRNGSVNEAYPTGGKAVSRLEFVNATATQEADLCVFGMRAPR